MAQSPITDFSKLIGDAEKTVRDGAYVALGLGILGFQQAQVRRHELSKRLGDRGALASQLSDAGERLTSELGKRFGTDAATGRAQLSQLAKTVDGRIAPVRRQLDEQVDAIEETLPATAKKVVVTVRAAASDAETRLRTLVGI
jgi:hypothetical protein